MNIKHIIVNPEDRFIVLVTLLQKLPNTMTVVFDTKFYEEAFIHLKVKTELVTASTSTDKLVIYYDPPMHTIQDKNALLFVLPDETAILTRYKDSKQQLIEKHKLSQFIDQALLKLVSRNFEIYTLAEQAFKYYMTTYAHKLDKQFYDVLKINPNQLCKSFGFQVPPKINTVPLKKNSEYRQNTVVVKKQVKKATKVIRKKK